MINVGTLVTLDHQKANLFHQSHLLQHSGIGMITEMPRVWKYNYQGNGIGAGLDLGSSDPSCWARVQFGSAWASIPSDYLIIVEDK